MAYCPNCGKPVVDDTASFCSNCSHPLKLNKESEPRSVREGVVHKCPNCGEAIDAFTANCPSCGYEFRGSKAASSVQRFASELSQANEMQKKVSIIRNFPIPNTKEDIFEFMLLASSNISGEQNKSIFDAWLVKFNQSYQKARLVIRDAEDLKQIQGIYDQTQKRIKREKIRMGAQALSNPEGRASRIVSLIGKNLAVVAGIVLYIMAIVTYKRNGNGSMLELAGVIVLIASAATLAKRNATLVEYIIGLLSGLLSIAMSKLLVNGSVLELGGVIVLIIVAVNFFRGAVKKGNKKEDE